MTFHVQHSMQVVDLLTVQVYPDVLAIVLHKQHIAVELYMHTL